MSFRPNVWPIFPSKSSLDRSAASLRRVAWCGFPDFVGTISGLRILAPHPAALRFLRLAVPRSRWLFAPDPVQRHRQTWACSRGDPPRCTVEKTRPPRFLGDPCAHAPLSDPGGPLKPSPYGSSDAAFRWDKHVGSAMKTFEAQSRGLCAPCLRFAAGVTSGPRKTRYRPVASLCRVGTSTRLDPSRRFPLQILSLSFPLLQALPGAMSPFGLIGHTARAFCQ